MKLLLARVSFNCDDAVILLMGLPPQGPCIDDVYDFLKIFVKIKVHYRTLCLHLGPMYESKEVSVIPGKNCQCMCLFCQLLCL